MTKKLYLIIVLTALLFSCAKQEANPDLQDIVSLWTRIEESFSADANLTKKDLLPAVDDFYLLLEKFEKSELYHTYSAIPSSPQTKRSFGLYPPSEIREVRVISDLVLVFRDSLVNRDRERAETVSAEVSGVLIRLLIIDGDVQRYVGASYLQLLFTLIVFIILTAVLIWVLYRSLTRSLQREAEGTVFSHAHILAQEKERSRIARELHDSVAQDIRCLSLQTGKLANALEEDQRKKLYEESLAAQEDLIRQIREICNGLVPPDFQFMGLSQALNKFCHDFGLRTGIACHLDLEEGLYLGQLGEEQQLQCFRIVQEALNNVEQHAGAGEAFVVIRNIKGERPGGRTGGRTGRRAPQVPAGLFLSVSDDGAGFDVSKKRPEGLGIKSMTERAAILSGRLVIESAKGEGTMVWAEVPLAPNKRENSHDKNHAH